MRLEPKGKPRALKLLVLIVLGSLVILISSIVSRTKSTSNWQRPAHLQQSRSAITAQSPQTTSGPLVVDAMSTSKAKTPRPAPSHTQLIPESQPREGASDAMKRIRTADEVKDFAFFRFQLAAPSGLWLSRPVDTNVDVTPAREKTFRIEFHKRYKAYSIKGHTRMHLTCELNNKVTIDRLWARSYEQWRLHFDADGSLMLESRRNSMFVRLGPKSDTLIADAGVEGATKWHLYGVQDAGCVPEARSSAGKGKKEAAKSKDLEERCWGKVPSMKPIAAGNNGASNATFLLFGSPKPLDRLEPAKADDPFDSFIIASRTLANWASIDQMQPLILTDDKKTIELVNTTAAALNRSILVSEDIEIQRQFSQPTYRGLFHAALNAAPHLAAFAYSNSDILYTPSLPETIAKVIEYVEREKQRKIASGESYKVKGWLIVGQRVNHVVPASWRIDAADRTRSWIDDIEKNFSKRGELFESDAEDYFIVSRDLFDWMKEIPDFVVGGVAFDNWITSKVNKMALKGTAVVVDATKTIVALHQNHGHNAKGSHDHPKSVYNSHLAAQNGGWTLGHTADALYATERRMDGSITVYDKHRLLYK